MQVNRLTVEDIPDSVVARLDEASLFSSVGFAQLWETVGGRVVFWITRVNDLISAVMTGVEFGWWPSRRFQAMPDGCYGNVVLIDQAAESDQLVAELLRVMAQVGYARLIINDYRGLFPSMTSYNIDRSHTMLVDISYPHWEPPDKRLMSQIHKAERTGISVQTYNAEKHRESFMSLVAETERRHGQQPKYPESFYDRLAQLASKDERVKWVYIEHKGCPIASHIFLVDGDMALHWQVFSDKKHASLRANQYIVFTMAHRLARHGVKWLNLGATPEDAAELLAYKQRWGGQIYQYRILHRRSWLGKLF